MAEQGLLSPSELARVAEATRAAVAAEVEASQVEAEVEAAKVVAKVAVATATALFHPSRGLAVAAPQRSQYAEGGSVAATSPGVEELQQQVAALTAALADEQTCKRRMMHSQVMCPHCEELIDAVARS